MHRSNPSQRGPGHFRARSGRAAAGLARVLALVLSLTAADRAMAADAAADLVARGKYLAEAADCMACHTAEHGGKPYAGGRSIDTTFGQVVSTNITPDRATGIGAWTDDEFYRAVHDGIGRRGEYLYPVMPFPWYTAMSRDDVLAIKAYLATVPPVRQPAQPNRLVFPASIRASLLAWRLAFFKAKTFVPDPQRSEQVNRGAYLVEGVAHCGECHNGNPIAGQSRWRRPLQGGKVDRWYAPNISADVRDGIGGWTEAQLVAYLKTGVAPGKGIAVGPMAEVVHGLDRLTDADLHAMAAYLKTTPAHADADPKKVPLYQGAGAAGAQTYLDFCASCHGVDGKGYAGSIPALASNGSVTAAGPQNIVRAVVGGLEATRGYGPMPAIGATMTDAQVAEVANYVRQTWSNAAAPTATPGMVADARAHTDTLMNPAPDKACPGIASPQVARAVAGAAVAQRLDRMTEATFWQDAAQLVPQVRAAAPKASRAELVNGLVAGYCPVLRRTTGLNAPTQATLLGQFGQLVDAVARGGASTQAAAALPVRR